MTKEGGGGPPQRGRGGVRGRIHKNTCKRKTNQKDQFLRKGAKEDRQEGGGWGKEKKKVLGEEGGGGEYGIQDQGVQKRKINQK